MATTPQTFAAEYVNRIAYTKTGGRFGPISCYIPRKTNAAALAYSPMPVLHIDEMPCMRVSLLA
jgi:hypothetical protein